VTQLTMVVVACARKGRAHFRQSGTLSAA